MRTEFENVSRKLVLISDGHDTITIREKPFVNLGWFGTLIQAREAGHTVIITSTDGDFGSVTALLLPKFDKPKDFFNVNLNGQSIPAVPKMMLKAFLDTMGIEKADFICENDDPLKYLRADQIGCYLDPRDFLPNAVPSGDFLRLRMALADPAP